MNGCSYVSDPAETTAPRGKGTDCPDREGVVAGSGIGEVLLGPLCTVNGISQLGQLLGEGQDLLRRFHREPGGQNVGAHLVNGAAEGFDESPEISVSQTHRSEPNI